MSRHTRFVAWGAFLVAVFSLLGLPSEAASQVPVPVPAEADTVPDTEPPITPGGAFLRSLVVPGWGHAAAGSHFRGAFYVAAQSGTAWMLTKSWARRNEARRFRAAELEFARDRLRAAGIMGVDTLRALAAQDPRVVAWDDLISSRSQQVEDWAALGIFLILLGATDAFVAGHLMDRPEPLTLDVVPPVEGRWEFRMSIQAGTPRRRP